MRRTKRRAYIPGAPDYVGQIAKFTVGTPLYQKWLDKVDAEGRKPKTLDEWVAWDEGDEKKAAMEMFRTGQRNWVLDGWEQ